MFLRKSQNSFDEKNANPPLARLEIHANVQREMEIKAADFVINLILSEANTTCHSLSIVVASHFRVERIDVLLAIAPTE